MRAENKLMCAEGFARYLLDIGQPLSCKSGPFEGAADLAFSTVYGGLTGSQIDSRVHDIVKEDGILLPDLILFIDHLVL